MVNHSMGPLDKASFIHESHTQDTTLCESGNVHRQTGRLTDPIYTNKHCLEWYKKHMYMY